MDHKNLDAWKKSVDLVEIIYKLFRNKLLPRIGYPGSVRYD